MPVTRDENFERMTTTCVDCGQPWSSAWPSDGPSRRPNAEATLRGYGWERSWGAWRCLDCRKVRAERAGRLAPWVAAVGVALLCGALALVVWGGM